MDKTLKQKAVSGMVWSVVQKFGVMFITFCSNLVLARLLSPEDYGVVGMLMIFILVSNTFVDGGFGSALIQKKEPTQEDYSTIFYWNLFLSIVLYCLLYILSPLIAKFYNSPLLSSVLKVQGIVLILNSLSIIQQNRFRKLLLFKKLAIVNITSAVLSLVVTIILAYKGFGVWSLVAQQLLLSFFNALLFFVVGKWMPSLVFCRKSFKELFRFGGFILLSNLINTICNNIQGLLIGKFFNSHTMGIYSQARKLEEIASTSISNVIDQVSYPIFSQVQNEKDKLIDVIKKLISSIAFFSFPLMFWLIIVAEPLITLLYSSRWIESVPYFQILCLAGLAISLQNVNYYAVAAIGKSKELFNWTIVKRLVSILVIVIGFFIYGIWGLMIGMVVGSYIIYFINAILVSKNIGYRLFAQIKDLLPIFFVTIMVFLITAAINYIGFDISNIIQKLILLTFTFVSFYLLFSFLFMKNKLKVIKVNVLDFIKKNNRNNEK